MKGGEKREREWGLAGTVTATVSAFSKLKPQHSRRSLTINPASTVGTSVNLLPSEIPRSWSLPELSRLQGRRAERDN